MRVISGTARGRRLNQPPAGSIRPTAEKVKESIFNIIQFDIEGRRVLDLFAGTGQLGIEALSRGAAGAVFVDSSGSCARLIRDNLRICGFSDKGIVYSADALRYLEYKEEFDIILLDPPYDALYTDKTLLGSKVIKQIIEFDKLSINGIIMWETRVTASMPDITLPYRLEKEYAYGEVALKKITRLEH